MKKLLVILLLSPLAQSEIIEYYCEQSINSYLTLKIDDDLNNKIFVIENSIDGVKIGDKNFIADVNNIKIMPITIFVLHESSSEYLDEMWEFNRVTGVLNYEQVNDNKAGNKFVEKYKSFIRSDSNIGVRNWSDASYICQPFKSNNP
tara:strand:+ start:45 stop:485 length:441 start_codon:yes stop_codon:yes gene_type:complete